MNMFNDKKLFTKRRKQIYISFILALALYFQFNLKLLRCDNSCKILYQIQPLMNGLMFCCLLILSFTVLHMLWCSNFSFGEKDCLLYSLFVILSLLLSAIFRAIFFQQKDSITSSATLTIFATSFNILIAVISAILPSRIARQERDFAQVSSSSSSYFFIQLFLILIFYFLLL